LRPLSFVASMSNRVSALYGIIKLGGNQLSATLSNR
jgi:hypothetical protein